MAYHPNEGIELLYVRECQHWQQTLLNLQNALAELKLEAEIKIIPIDTIEQAVIYNFFSSPTIHIDGQDIDNRVSRISKRGLGKDRPYFFGGRSWPVPPHGMIIEALQRLYLQSFDRTPSKN